MQRARILDVVLALAVAAVALVELFARGSGDHPTSVVAVVYVIGPIALAWRRTHPLLVAVVTGVAILGPLAFGLQNDNFGQFVAYLMAAFSLGAHATGWAARISVLAGWLAAVAVAGFLVVPVADAAGMVVLVIGSSLVGRGLRGRDRTVDDLRAENHRLATEREQREKQAVADERARMARELHDIVGHSVSLMVLQTGAGRKTVRSDQDRTEEMLRSAEATGRQALAEMKRLVGIMRLADDSGELSPQPGLDQIPDLVRRSETAGLSIDYEVSGQPVLVPPGLGLSAYRIVQEAITNAIKHSGGSRIRVEVSYEPEVLQLVITDDGPHTRWPPREPGHGLTGMRERVALYDGTLTVAPGRIDGLAVMASFPLGEA